MSFLYPPQNMPMMQSPFNFINKIPMAPPLYVGNLDESITDEVLFNFFYRFGPIHFVRVMRDPATGKSRGFAYVNFVNPRDADSARQYAMYDKLGKKPIRIMLKRNVKELDPKANVYVKNLDSEVTDKELYDFCSQARPVISVRVSRDESGKSLGYGYVQFENAEDAQTAITQLNGSKLRETEVELLAFVPRDKREAETKQRNIYVKNLPLNVSETEVTAAVDKVFSKFGEIETRVVKKHPSDNKYCAFVCFKNEDAAQAAVSELTANPPTLADAEGPLYVNWHQNKLERIEEHNKLENQTRKTLYVKELKSEVTGNDLKAAFQQFGNIQSVDVQERSRNGTNAKFGIVSFSTEEEANNAVNESLKEQAVQDLFVKGTTPYVRFHQSRKQRNEFLFTQRRKHEQFQVMPPNPNFFTNRRFQPIPMMENPGFRGNQRGGQFNRGGFQNAGGFGGPRYKGNRHGQGGPREDRRQHHHQQPRTQHPQQQTQQPQTTPQTSQVNMKSRLEDLMSMAPDRQREVLGELLFPLVKQRAGDSIAPKITGMLVDLEVLTVPEIVEFLENPKILDERIAEAISIVEEEGM